jgi:hypothetical protein
MSQVACVMTPDSTRREKSFAAGRPPARLGDVRRRLR